MTPEQEAELVALPNLQLPPRGRRACPAPEPVLTHFSPYQITYMSPLYHRRKGATSQHHSRSRHASPLGLPLPTPPSGGTGL